MQPTTSEPTGHKILIVDDSRATQAILRRIVMKTPQAEGADIRVVDSAVEALRVVEGFAPDLIITDWHMPEVSGLELVQTLRQLGHHRVRVGLVTADTHPGRVVEAQSNGVSFVLNKPFRDKALLEAMRTTFEELQSVADAPSPAAGRRSEAAAFEVARPPGPVSFEGLRRLFSVALKSVTHEVVHAEPLRFPRLTPTVLRCQYVQASTGASVLALLDLPALFLVGAGAQGAKALQTAFDLGAPEADLVQRATTVMRVSAKLLDGHADAAPFTMERCSVVARAVADEADLLSKSLVRTDLLITAVGFEGGRVSFLRAPA